MFLVEAPVLTLASFRQDVTDTEETFYDVSASVEETFYDVSAGPCSHLPDEIIMEIFSYLPPDQVWYRTSMLLCSVLDLNFFMRLQRSDSLTSLLILSLERGSHVP